MDRNSITLSELTSFCTKTFPLLRWMHRPVPGKLVNEFFEKVRIFFVFHRTEIPNVNRGEICTGMEMFLRCAYDLAYHLEKEPQNVGYPGDKLLVSYNVFMSYCKKFGYKPPEFLSQSEELIIRYYLLEIQSGLSHVLKIGTDGKDLLLPPERELIHFVLYIIHYIFTSASNIKSIDKHLPDLPEGVTLPFFKALQYTFQSYLKVDLPARSDSWDLSEFSTYVGNLFEDWTSLEE